MPSVRSTLVASAALLSLFGSSEARALGKAGKAPAAAEASSKYEKLPAWIKATMSAKHIVPTAAPLDKRAQVGATCYGDAFSMAFDMEPAITPACSALIGIPVVTTTTTMTTG